MPDFRVGKTDLAGLVVKIVTFESVAAELLKTAIPELNRICRGQTRLTALNHKRRVVNRKSFGKVRIIRERRAIPHRKYRRNEVQAILIAAPTDRIEAPEKVRRLFGESVQVKRDNRAIKMILAGRFENFGNLGDIAVLFKSPSENPDKLVGKTWGGVEPRGKQAGTGEQKTLVHTKLLTEAKGGGHRTP